MSRKYNTTRSSMLREISSKQKRSPSSKFRKLSTGSKRSSRKVLSAQNKNSSIRNTIKNRTITDSDINNKLEKLDSRLTYLEEHVGIIIGLIDKQESNEDFHTPNMQIITPQYDNKLANNTGLNTEDSGVSQYFRTPMQAPDYNKELIDAVNNGELQPVKAIIEEKMASPNIRDSEEYSLPVIAYIHFATNKNNEGYGNIIKYLLTPKVQLDPSIREEYNEFVKLHNKTYRKLGGKLGGKLDGKLDGKPRIKVI